MSTKIRVIHTSMIKNWGGGEKQLINLYQGLKQFDVEQMILCADNSELQKACKQKAINHLIIRKRGNISLSASFALQQICRRYQPTLLHVHDTVSHNYAVLANLLPQTNLPIVISRRLAIPLKQKFITKYKYTNQHIKNIICVSQAVQNAVSTIVPKNQSTVIYEGFNVAEFSRTAKQHSLASPPIIASIGRLGKEKGHQLFINMAADLLKKGYNARFQIIGTGPEEENIRAAVAKKNLNEHVALLGFKQDIAKELEHIDILAITSKTEALSLAALEAMAAKVPVVAVKIDGIQEIVHHQQTGMLVEQRDSQQMAACIIELLENQLLRQRIVDQAFQFVTQFNIENMSKNIFALYNQIIQ